MQKRRSPFSVEQESAFQRDMRSAPAYSPWFNQFTKSFGEEPDLNSSNYDYRTAWQQGIAPQSYEHDKGLRHWPSSTPVAPYARPVPLKSQNHPTAWMETFMQTYGVDPHEATPDQLQDAQRRGIIAFPR